MATDAGLDGDAERLAGLGLPLTAIAEITQGCSFEATAGKLVQHRDDALAVMDVRRRDVDRQPEAVFIDGEMDLDALDLLAAVETAREATRRRMTGPAIDDDGAGYGFVAGNLPSGKDQAVEQAAPQAKPGPANAVELANRSPLHAAERHAPERHDRLAHDHEAAHSLRQAGQDRHDAVRRLAVPPFEFLERSLAPGVVPQGSRRC